MEGPWVPKKDKFMILFCNYGRVRRDEGEMCRKGHGIEALGMGWDPPDVGKYLWAWVWKMQTWSSRVGF